MLQIAAGILIAAGIFAVIALGFAFIRNHDQISNTLGVGISLICVGLAAALVVIYMAS